MFNIFLIGCIAKTTDSSFDPANQQWRSVIEDDERGAWMSIWQAPEGEIWIVGGQPEEAKILKCSHTRCDMDSFEEMELPQGTPLLNWVHGTSNVDVWVGGLQGTLLHWNGVDWEDYSQPIEEAIWGIYALSSDEVYAVGGTSRWGGTEAVVFSKSTDGFVSIPLPTELEDLPNLFKVSHDGDKFWLVGQQGALLQCETECVPIPTGITADLITISNQGNRLHVVGGRGTGIYFLIEDGVLGDIQQVPAGMNGVDAQNDSVFMVGERGYASLLEHGTEQELPSITLDVLHAAMISDEGLGYAVGGNLFTSDPFFHGIVLTYQVEP